jgi:OPT family oligopeptide transporter
MEMPVDTIRAWMIGLFWAIIMPGLNQFLYFRYPSITIGSLVAQLLSFPLGCAWARLVPEVRILGFPLNPGPFSLKEHVLITVMATVGSSSAYATDILAVQRKYYHQNWSFAYQWLLVMSTQLIGFSMGGAIKRFLVSPPSMSPCTIVFRLFSSNNRALMMKFGQRTLLLVHFLIPYTPKFIRVFATRE